MGFGCGVGDALTFQVLDDETQQVLYRSSIRSRNPSNEPTHPLNTTILEEPNTQTETPIYSFIHTSSNDPPYDPNAPIPSGTLSPDELIGRSFLLDEDEDGQRL